MGARLALALGEPRHRARPRHDGRGRRRSPARRGLYGTVAFAFLATVVYGLVLPRDPTPAALRGAQHRDRHRDRHRAGPLLGGPGFGLHLPLRAGGGLRCAALRAAGARWSPRASGSLAYGAVLLLAGPAPAGRRASAIGPADARRAAAHALGGPRRRVASSRCWRACSRGASGAPGRPSTSGRRDLQRLRESPPAHRREPDERPAHRGSRRTRSPRSTPKPSGSRASRARLRSARTSRRSSRESASSRSPPAGDDSAQGRVRARPTATELGEDLHLGLAAYILKDAGGAPSGHVVIFQDVTDVVEMEARAAALGAAGRRRRAFGQHRPRDPQSAGGHLGLDPDAAKREADALGGAVEAKRLMDIVLRETDRLNHLITDFLQYARPGPLHLEPVARRESAVEEVLEMFEAIVPENVEVDAERADGRSAVRADAGSAAPAALEPGAERLPGDAGGRQPVHGGSRPWPSRRLKRLVPPAETSWRRRRRLGRRSRFGTRGSGFRPTCSGAHLRSLLHHEAGGVRAGARDRASHRRGAWREHSAGEHWWARARRSGSGCRGQR